MSHLPPLPSEEDFEDDEDQLDTLDYEWDYQEPWDNSEEEIELCRLLLKHGQFLTGKEIQDLTDGTEDQGINPDRLKRIHQNHASELP